MRLGTNALCHSDWEETPQNIRQVQGLPAFTKCLKILVCVKVITTFKKFIFNRRKELEGNVRSFIELVLLIEN